jgi:uncharacterized membrane protein YeaQ/YmgE (transglycosylase-associated protein family)
MIMGVLFWITLGILAAAIAKLVVWENASWSAVLPLGSLGAIAGGVGCERAVAQLRCPRIRPSQHLSGVAWGGCAALAV